jgi:hypothetical protein
LIRLGACRQQQRCKMASAGKCWLIRLGACRQQQRCKMASAGNGSFNTPRIYGRPSYPPYSNLKVESIALADPSAAVSTIEPLWLNHRRLHRICSCI